MGSYYVFDYETNTSNRNRKRVEELMNKMQEQLREWHKKFGVIVNDTPTIPDKRVRELRIKLMYEELVKELIPALEKDNIIEIADGIADLLYVTIGTAVSYGINIEPIFDEVHRSNMTKLWPDGTVHYNDYGKVIKPETYSPANIVKELEKQMP